MNFRQDSHFNPRQVWNRKNPRGDAKATAFFFLSRDGDARIRRIFFLSHDEATEPLQLFLLRSQLAT